MRTFALQNMIECIINDRTISTALPSGALLLDLIRYDQHLTGTKIGCREGDCGACNVLVGELIGDTVDYRSVTSCLTPIANAAGRHIVTIEGLNMEMLSPIQQAIVDTGGTQCGFCTPGFVVSLTGCCMRHERPTYSDAIAAMDGNICRCTGYKSLERAALRITEAMQNLNSGQNGAHIHSLIGHGCIPGYFTSIPGRLKELNQTQPSPQANGTPVGGGTDLYVQRPDALIRAHVQPLNMRKDLSGIAIENGTCMIGAQTTVTQMMESEVLSKMIPGLHEFMKLVSSTPIRNISTIAGNLVNASPIGDLTIFFLALNAHITLQNESSQRDLPLKEFYRGYKQLDLAPGEIITTIHFVIPDAASRFNFEKVSKRTYLDIASVNTALQISGNGERIDRVHLSAGGVSPVPAYLRETCTFLAGQQLSPEVIRTAAAIMQEEISPISDVRGSSAYKRLLLRQLFYAHFIRLYPETFSIKVLR